MGDQRWIAVTLNGMGETLLDMGQIETAEAQLRQALEISTAIQSVPDSLDSLAGLGEISAVLRDSEAAVIVLAQVNRHSVTKPQARARAERVLTQLKDTIPSEVWQAAKAQGENMTLNEVIDRMALTA
jgi:fumarate hydratase class II